MNDRLSPETVTSRLADVSERPRDASLNRRLALQRDWEAALRRETSSHTNVQLHDVLLLKHESTDMRSCGSRSLHPEMLKPLPHESLRAITRPADGMGGAYPPAREGVTGSGGNPGHMPMSDEAPATAFTALADRPVPKEEPLSTGSPESWGPGFELMRSIDWAPYAVHIMRRGTHVKVWVRDQHLTRGGGRRLLMELRSTLAKAGLHLASLVVNGAPVGTRHLEMV